MKHWQIGILTVLALGSLYLLNMTPEETVGEFYNWKADFGMAFSSEE